MKSIKNTRINQNDIKVIKFLLNAKLSHKEISDITERAESTVCYINQMQGDSLEEYQEIYYSKRHKPKQDKAQVNPENKGDSLIYIELAQDILNINTEIKNISRTVNAIYLKLDNLDEKTKKKFWSK